MLRNYAALDSLLLRAGSGFCQPAQNLPQRAGFDDSAENVMTDLKQVSAVLIRPGDGIDDANQRMIQRGLFSATQIARQLGVAIQTSEIAQTFSEIEALLSPLRWRPR